MSHSTSCASPPSIRIYDSGISRHGRHPSSRRAPSYSTTPAVPMPIPHAREAPPPPLPPPRYISGLDTGNHQPDLTFHQPHAPWQVENSRHDVGSPLPLASKRSGLSLLGAMRAQKEDLRDFDTFNRRVDRRKDSTATSHTVDTEMTDALDASDEETLTLSRRPSVVSRRYVLCNTFPPFLPSFAPSLRISEVNDCAWILDMSFFCLQHICHG
jgi:hypothetical protein